MPAKLENQSSTLVFVGRGARLMMSLPLLAWEMEEQIESPPKRRFVETTESGRQDLLDSAKVRGRSFPPRHGLKLLVATAIPAQLTFTL